MSRARLPRLTLFSGPCCSLCDVAKEELAKVRSQAPFSLQVVDIHSPGQDKWKRLYQYDIPVLHLEDQMIMKHRMEPERLVKRLEEWSRVWKEEAEGEGKT
ncbi:DUF836-domain-containing protein [Calocera viscosa TUFC12733]|uniref:Glutaredoxin-like protein n=1 Tax=Calocera viscosa (strain TUFC12733) TaxID=1330018 RepID=A0A167S248_CALVF|nr:DUF836-domain-containing protein [Calocera viscosa TUFC12733]